MGKRHIDADTERANVGGVFIVRNNSNGKVYLDCTLDIKDVENRFELSRKINSCIFLKLKKDWEASGPDAFSFDILQILPKSKDQTNEGFMDDLMTLKNIKLEQYEPDLLY